MIAKRCNQTRWAGDFRCFAIKRQRRNAPRKFRDRLTLHLFRQQRHQDFGNLAGIISLKRGQCFGQTTRQEQSLLTRKCSTQGLDLGLVFANKPCPLGLVKRLCFPVAVLAPCFECQALFFLDGDNGGDFGLLGSGGFFSRDGALRSIAARLWRGVSFSGFGGAGAAMISTASSSI